MTLSTIKDGRGTGRLLKVDSEGRAHTFSVTEREEQHTNRLNQDAYISFVALTPTGAGDVFYYIKNTDTRDMILSWYRIWAVAGAEAIDIYKNPAGTPTNTTAITPVSANFASKKAASVANYESVNMGGLSGATLVDRLRLSGDGNDVVENYPGGLILPQGASFCAQALNGAVPIEFTISFYYTKLATA